jgi:hypothetical protein
VPTPLLIGLNGIPSHRPRQTHRQRRPRAALALRCSFSGANSVALSATACRCRCRYTRARAGRRPARLERQPSLAAQANGHRLCAQRGHLLVPEEARGQAALRSDAAHGRRLSTLKRQRVPSPASTRMRALAWDGRQASARPRLAATRWRRGLKLHLAQVTQAACTISAARVVLSPSGSAAPRRAACAERSGPSRSRASSSAEP